MEMVSKLVETRRWRVSLPHFSAFAKETPHRDVSTHSELASFEAISTGASLPCYRFRRYSPNSGLAYPAACRPL